MFKFIFKRKIRYSNDDYNTRRHLDIVCESIIDEKNRNSINHIRNVISSFPYFDESLEKARQEINKIKETNSIAQKIMQTDEERISFDKGCRDKMNSILDNLIEKIRTEFLNNVIN